MNWGRGRMKRLWIVCTVLRACSHLRRSCLRRNDGGAVGMAEGAAWVTEGVGWRRRGWCGRLERDMTAGGRLLLLTPHLTSPLEGGRDELGKGG